MLNCRHFIGLTILMFTYELINAQSTTGLTNKPDTSFSVYTEYIKNKKTHPKIKIAEEFHSPSIKENRNISYCNINDRKLSLDVFYPSTKTKQKHTAIMFIYGGGWRSGNRTQHYPLAQRLAALGYVVITPEYRLSTEALYPAAVYDLKAALRWIHANAKKYKIDTAQIAVGGFSAGGQLAALLGTTVNDLAFEGNEGNQKYSSTVHAIIDVDGTLSFVHPESGEGDDSKKTSSATYWFGYSKKENLKLWEDASPLAHVSMRTPPTLFINSSVARMHAGRNDFTKVLEENKIYSETKIFEDAPHSFILFEPWFTPSVKYIDDFLKRIFR